MIDLVENGRENSSDVDLTNCDKEAIHQLGRVQSYGALMAISPDWIVNHASVNLSEFIGVEATDVIGTPVGEYLSSDAIHLLRSRLQMLSGADSVERLFGIKLTTADRLFDVAIHYSGSLLILEMENHEPDSLSDANSYIRPMMERIGAAETPQRLCEVAARQLRGLVGFDRVMVYKFDETGSGTVVAESLSGPAESFLGLRYPASDIPKQARELYKRSLLRIIADVSDHGVEVIPRFNPEGQSLDLSLSSTRAVSPIHLEYLTNMGVGASLSISILKRGKLWGLFACHHNSPKSLNYPVRSAAELFGQLFAFLLEQREGDQERAEEAEARALHDQLMTQLADGSTIAESLDTVLTNLKAVIPFDGAIGWLDGQFTSVGRTPTREEFMGMVKFLNTTAVSRIYAHENLVSVYPKAENFAERTAGIMVLPVSRTPRDFIVLCRQEVVNMVNWAGNPEKPVVLGKNGARLTPRKSFEAWQQVVRNSCSPWSKGERRAAESLRITLLEVVLRMSDAALKEQAKARDRQELLIAELNHRVRNILNLIRGLINQSKDEARSIDQFTEIVGGRVQALARAHDQITKENWSPASAQELIETEAAAYLNTKKDRVVMTGPDALVTPVAFTTLSLVMHELMTNSMKYGALIDARGSVEVKLARQGDGALEITWREIGGPPIQKPPTRKGFGTTIIERSIPFELNGEADVSFKTSGLEARFIIPPAYVSSFEEREKTPDKPVLDIAPKAKLSGHVLIVEDNVIIAMDAEDLMIELGAASVMVVSDVESAIEEIYKSPIQFALLDINLGQETSEPIAAALTQKGIAFAFATGYGASTAITKRFQQAPVVQKPYNKAAIQFALEALSSN